jgi:hypothetical protein
VAAASRPDSSPQAQVDSMQPQVPVRNLRLSAFVPGTSE